MPILDGPHICPHEQEIGQFKKTISRIDKEVFGNGGKGLSKDVTILKLKMDDIKDDIEKLATSYSALAKSEIEKDAIEQAKIDLEKRKLEERKKRSSIIQRLGTISAIVFGAIGILYVILDHLATH